MPCKKMGDGFPWSCISGNVALSDNMQKKMEEATEKPSKMTSWWHAIVLLRIPFSVFLLPMFLIGLAFSPGFETWRVLTLFVLLHFFIYPASNGYNSWHDQDEGPIGGLAAPPKPPKQLYWLVTALDVASVLLALVLGWACALWALGYILASRAYSHRIIRIKRSPLFSTLLVTGFQGMGVVFLVLSGMNPTMHQTQLYVSHFAVALGATFTLMGSYPITQIYQHEADKANGDLTLSRLLGIRGTLLWSGLCLTIGIALMTAAFVSQLDWRYGLLFLVGTQPAALFFIWWTVAVWRNEDAANYANTMRMNALSGIGLTVSLLAINYFYHY